MAPNSAKFWNTGVGIAGGAAAGAALMYIFDPRRGASRRARVRDEARHLARSSERFIDVAARDAEHRTSGLSHLLKTALTQAVRSSEPPSDTVLVDRARAKLGRYVSHPHAVEITVKDGVLELRGLIIAEEAEPLLRALGRLEGVREVRSLLSKHARGENIPSLQGGRPRTGERPDITQSHWAPATRLLVGMFGGDLIGFALKRKSPIGWALGALGLLALARSYTNEEFREVLKLGRQEA